VFLFLGYSETDEALLKPHSNLSIQDAVVSLQDFMRHESSNKVQSQNAATCWSPNVATGFTHLAVHQRAVAYTHGSIHACVNALYVPECIEGYYKFKPPTCWVKVKVKVKQSRYRPRRAQRVPGS